MASILDLSAEQPNPPPPTMVKGKDGIVRPKPKARILRGKVVERTPTGITLHQTWCWYGGKSLEAIHRRALRVHAHWTCFRDGTAVLGYPLHWYVHHGNGWNATDVGIEGEGMYDGPAGTPIKVPRGFSYSDMIEGMRLAVRETVTRCPTVRYVHAHRQSSGGRTNDPGRPIWHDVALWSVREFGLVMEPERTLRDGLPLKPDWLAG